MDITRSPNLEMNRNYKSVYFEWQAMFTPIPVEGSIVWVASHMHGDTCSILIIWAETFVNSSNGLWFVWSVVHFLSGPAFNQNEVQTHPYMTWIPCCLGTCKYKEIAICKGSGETPHTQWNRGSNSYMTWISPVFRYLQAQRNCDF